MKLIIFDLDGVLVEAKEIHFEALNKALGKKFKISLEEHLSIYDGLKTNDKLELLHIEKGLPKSMFNEIWKNKQKETIKSLNYIKSNKNLIEIFKYLKSKGIKVAVCSNLLKNRINCQKT